MRGFYDHPNRERQQCQAIRLGSERLVTAVAVSSVGAGGTLRDSDGDDFEQQRSGIRQHMRGLRQQRDGVGPEPAHRFDHGEREKQRECRAQAPLTGILCMIVPMPAVAVVMAVVIFVIVCACHIKSQWRCR